MVEAVAGLGLERRRAGAAHPAPVAAHGIGEPGLARCAGRLDGREDAAACSVQLLVARSAGAQVELGYAIAAEARVCVAVHEPRDRTEAATVELLDSGCVAAEPRVEAAHRPGRDDPSVLAQDISIVDDLQVAERTASERRLAPGRRRQLCEVANEQAGRGAVVAHAPGSGGIGASSP